MLLLRSCANKIIITLFLFFSTFNLNAQWKPDLGNGKYKNPIIFADYSDPDLIRVGDDYYMVASSFNCMPGIPILHSKDLVGWEIIGHVYDNLPLQKYDKVKHGEGSWAPSIRYNKNNGLFYVFVCSPYDGLWCATAKDIKGPWETELIENVEMWEDPCPLFDDDGNVYLVHSKYCGNTLYLNKMSKDGKKILDNGTVIFEHPSQPTIEGPKFFKKDGYYYIFAPAGGVSDGWQTVLRSKNIYGPYEYKKVLHQGNSEINGPHQGGIVETQAGEWWFIHFQERQPYGRILHLQPAAWKDDWIQIGIDSNKDGIGEPVMEYKKPNVGKKYPAITPQTNDDFETNTLGFQWQWQANPQKEWYSLSAKPGSIRLYSVKNYTRSGNFKFVPNLLLQKFPAPTFRATTKVTFSPELENEKCGLTVMGKNWSFISVEKSGDNLQLSMNIGLDNKCEEDTKAIETISLTTNTVYLRVSVETNAVCKYSYSLDGQAFIDLGTAVSASPGIWIGAKVGVFSVNPNVMESKGYADFDWFKVEDL